MVADTEENRSRRKGIFAPISETVTLLPARGELEQLGWMLPGLLKQRIHQERENRQVLSRVNIPADLLWRDQALL